MTELAPNPPVIVNRRGMAPLQIRLVARYSWDFCEKISLGTGPVSSLFENFVSR